MMASQNGYLDVVQKLLQHGATVVLQEQVYTSYMHYPTELMYTAASNG